MKRCFAGMGVAVVLLLGAASTVVAQELDPAAARLADAPATIIMLGAAVMCLGLLARKQA